MKAFQSVESLPPPPHRLKRIASDPLLQQAKHRLSDSLCVKQTSGTFYATPHIHPGRASRTRCRGGCLSGGRHIPSVQRSPTTTTTKQPHCKIFRARTGRPPCVPHRTSRTFRSARATARALRKNRNISHLYHTSGIGNSIKLLYIFIVSSGGSGCTSVNTACICMLYVLKYTWEI